MPIVAHSSLPTFQDLRRAGQEVLSLDGALSQDIRELHIGLLNMMPDAALRVTERQFLRMVGNANQIVQLYVHPFSVPGLERSAETRAYIERHYTTFDALRTEGLDALIITGANVANPALVEEPFWQPLEDVVEWASKQVTSVLCSCLATHSLLKHFHGIDRVPLPRKRWGVYDHRVTTPRHPLLRDVNTRFDVPHSRHNDIDRSQFERAGLTVLAESAEGGVHLAVSADQFRVVYFQGHPEYDLNSLLKEYVREAYRWFAGARDDVPPYPEHYFSEAAVAVVERWWEEARTARTAGTPRPTFPEQEVTLLLDNTWGDSGKAFFNNWLGAVYRLTHRDRRKVFDDGVDPDDPLGLRRLGAAP
jgi:homoserine O-succinyltransferase